jgi:hypothetical protein
MEYSEFGYDLHDKVTRREHTPRIGSRSILRRRLATLSRSTKHGYITDVLTTPLVARRLARRHAFTISPWSSWSWSCASFRGDDLDAVSLARWERTKSLQNDY